MKLVEISNPGSEQGRSRCNRWHGRSQPRKLRQWKKNETFKKSKNFDENETFEGKENVENSTTKKICQRTLELSPHLWLTMFIKMMAAS